MNNVSVHPQSSIIFKITQNKIGIELLQRMETEASNFELIHKTKGLLTHGDSMTVQHTPL